MRASSQASLGRFLKDLRGAKRLSLREVENRTAVSNAYLSQLENDAIQKPSPHILHKLATLYAIEYAYLMQKAGYFVPSDSTDPEHKQGNRSFALSSMKDLSPEEEEALLEYLAFLRTRRRRKK